jgi:hypothetical protein
MPQVWKSLALDYQVPVSFPLSVTVEGIYTKTMNGVMLKNYNLNNQMLHGIVFLVLMTGIFIPKADITYTEKCIRFIKHNQRF